GSIEALSAVECQHNALGAGAGSLHDRLAVEVDRGDLEGRVAKIEALRREATNLPDADSPNPDRRSCSASSTDRTMTMQDALFARATAALVKARNTSMTATTPVARLAPSTKLAITTFMSVHSV